MQWYVRGGDAAGRGCGVAGCRAVGGSPFVVERALTHAVSFAVLLVVLRASPRWLYGGVWSARDGRTWGVVGVAACGLKWRDEQKREERAAALRNDPRLAMATPPARAAASSAASSPPPAEAAADGTGQAPAAVPAPPPAEAAADGAAAAPAAGASPPPAQEAADGAVLAAAAVSAATAEAQAAAAEVVAAADSPAPSGSPALDAAAAGPAPPPPVGASADGATPLPRPAAASAAPAAQPPAAGNAAAGPLAMADTASEHSSELGGADPWWCPQCATPDLPSPRVRLGGNGERCEGTFAVGRDGGLAVERGGARDGWGVFEKGGSPALLHRLDKWQPVDWPPLVRCCTLCVGVQGNARADDHLVATVTLLRLPARGVRLFFWDWGGRRRGGWDCSVWPDLDG